MTPPQGPPLRHPAQAPPPDDVTALHSQASQRLYACPTLPLPGDGDTVVRWRALSDLGAHDVCLAKLLEAHHDAHAILLELGAPAPVPGERWAVWAAEPPGATLVYTADEGGDGDSGTLSGTKAWCSGADFASHALVTTRDGDGRGLARVALSADGIAAASDHWQAVGMARVASGTLHFDHAPAVRVGAPGAYLSRPGFWHGGAGIAACWHGAACAIAETLRMHPRAGTAPHIAAHLGMVDCHLSAAAALLREVAALVDADPARPHVEAVLRLRSFIERVAMETIDRVGRALGAGPLCGDRAHALRCADLATFVRQSHAESDWEAVGRAVHTGTTTWRP